MVDAMRLPAWLILIWCVCASACRSPAYVSTSTCPSAVLVALASEMNRHLHAPNNNETTFYVAFAVDDAALESVRDFVLEMPVVPSSAITDRWASTNAEGKPIKLWSVEVESATATSASVIVQWRSGPESAEAVRVTLARSHGSTGRWVVERRASLWIS
jgi:hypothetical protein